MSASGAGRAVAANDTGTPLCSKPGDGPHSGRPAAGTGGLLSFNANRTCLAAVRFTSATSSARRYRDSAHATAPGALAAPARCSANAAPSNALAVGEQLWVEWAKNIIRAPPRHSSDAAAAATRCSQLASLELKAPAPSGASDDPRSNPVNGTASSVALIRLQRRRCGVGDVGAVPAAWAGAVVTCHADAASRTCTAHNDNNRLRTDGNNCAMVCASVVGTKCAVDAASTANRSMAPIDGAAGDGAYGAHTAASASNAITTALATASWSSAAGDGGTSGAVWSSAPAPAAGREPREPPHAANNTSSSLCMLVRASESSTRRRGPPEGADVADCAAARSRAGNAAKDSAGEGSIVPMPSGGPVTRCNTRSTSEGNAMDGASPPSWAHHTYARTVQGTHVCTNAAGDASAGQDRTRSGVHCRNGDVRATTAARRLVASCSTAACKSLASWGGRYTTAARRTPASTARWLRSRLSLARCCRARFVPAACKWVALAASSVAFTRQLTTTAPAGLPLPSPPKPVVLLAADAVGDGGTGSCTGDGVMVLGRRDGRRMEEAAPAPAPAPAPPAPPGLEAGPTARPPHMAHAADASRCKPADNNSATPVDGVHCGHNAAAPAHATRGNCTAGRRNGLYCVNGTGSAANGDGIDTVSMTGRWKYVTIARPTNAADARRHACWSVGVALSLALAVRSATDSAPATSPSASKTAAKAGTPTRPARL